MQPPESDAEPDPKERIRQFVLTEILETPDAELADDTLLISDGLMNSLSTLKLVSFLEETFGIELAAHEISVRYLDSIEQITEFVNEKTGS